MGLLSGSLSFRRYRVIGKEKDNFLEAVMTRRFHENLTARSSEDNAGWVNLVDPDDTDFNLMKIQYNHYIVLTMRVDKKRVPAKLLSILHKRRCKEVMTQKGLERLSASHRKDIKEALEEELLSQALPTVAVHDMCWDLNAGELRFFSTSDSVNELFRALFKETFQLDLAPINLDHWLERSGINRAEIRERIADLRPDINLVP